MTKALRSRVARYGVVLGLLLATPVGRLAPVDAQAPSESVSDQEFWRLVTELSEPGGTFTLQFMSNEDSALYVIPKLKEAAPRGGVYLGVGPEQNFTYIAAIQPRLSFIIDIRRDNMVELLMYKALF